jgi:hypothetical protein
VIPIAQMLWAIAPVSGFAAVASVLTDGICAARRSQSAAGRKSNSKWTFV